MFKTILLAVDVNDLAGSERPAEAAIGLATASGGEVHVMNVVPDFGMSIVGSYFSPDHNARILAEAKEALQGWAKDKFQSVANVRLHVDQGTIYDQVLKEADKVGADVIVVGAHKSQLQDYLMGPNSARIARHASQTVMVVR